jgi:glycerate 2-kinase
MRSPGGENQAKHVVVVPDKFKSTFSSAEVAAALGKGFRRAGFRVLELPAADGGEGTTAAVLRACDGVRVSVTVTDALGEEVEAELGLLAGGRIAVVEAAQASGLWRVEGRRLDVWNASTRGTGQLIAAAVAAGAREIVVAPGGTASVDGGLGAIEAIPPGTRLRRVQVACDVRTPWERAAEIFGPQKGADAELVARLALRLDRLAQRLPHDPRGVPMTGCGGGLSGGLWASFDAELVSGAKLVLDLLGFDALLADACLVVTGEGAIDAQTEQGKLVDEVSGRCARVGVPCVAVVGRNSLDAGGARRLRLADVVQASDAHALQEVAYTRGSRWARPHPRIFEP